MLPHATIRFSLILIARLLIVLAVKMSAALVATIANSHPDDALNGALDASGAFLTWATAIFTRFYYEAVKMTLIAVGFYHHGAVWDVELRRYLSPLYKKLKPQRDQEHGYDNGWPEQEEIPVQLAALLPQVSNRLEDLSEEERALYIQHPLTFAQRFKGGRIDRKLLMLTALLFMIAEIAALTKNLLQLVGYLTQRNAFMFSSSENAGQCGIRRNEVPMLSGLAILQVIYYLTNQPSLVPLLIFAAMMPSSEDGFSARFANGFRRVVGVVLLVWTLSFLCIPLFLKPLEPFFVVGDISLFWYVLLAPPDYNTVHYRISAAYTIITAIIGLIILYGLRRNVRFRQRYAQELADMDSFETEFREYNVS